MKKIRRTQYMDKDFYNFFNGTFKETFNALVTSDGSINTMTLTESSGASSLTCQFSDGNTAHATPSTVVLTGTDDTVPVNNYVYILKTDPSTLVCNQTGFPTDVEHIKVSYFLVPSATYVQSDGVYINNNWNDHLMNGNKQGHMSHMTERARRDGAYYFSGLAANGSDQGASTSYFDYVGSAESYFMSTAGVIYQMHRHSIGAKDSRTTDIHVINWNGTSYNPFNNISLINEDSGGNSLNNKYYNLFFFAVGNKTGEYAPLMCQLPDGSYNSAASAENDVDLYDNLVIPREFSLDSATGVPICRMTLRNSGGTTTHISTKDLRRSAGEGGTGSAGSTHFADNQFEVFDSDDITRIIDLDAGGITTGNTRTLTMQDRDITIEGWKAYAAVSSTPYNATLDARYLGVDASGAAVTVNLPTASGIAGATFTIQKTDSSANTVTVDPSGAETINGQSTKIINFQYSTMDIVSNGTNWAIQ